MIISRHPRVPIGLSRCGLPTLVHHYYRRPAPALCGVTDSPRLVGVDNGGVPRQNASRENRIFNSSVVRSTYIQIASKENFGLLETATLYPSVVGDEGERYDFNPYFASV